MSPAGRVASFLVTHTLALGANEYEHSGKVTFDQDDGSATCVPDPRSMVGSHIPGSCFSIASALPDDTAEIGGDELLYLDGSPRGHPCVSIRTVPTGRFGVILCGTNGGVGSMPKLLAACRSEWKQGRNPSAPPLAAVRLSGCSSPQSSVGRLDEMLPWLAHNAAIHFSAPHGLEQQGGAAWGVRGRLPGPC